MHDIVLCFFSHDHSFSIDDETNVKKKRVFVGKKTHSSHTPTNTRIMPTQWPNHRSRNGIIVVLESRDLRLYQCVTSSTIYRRRRTGHFWLFIHIAQTIIFMANSMQTISTKFQLITHTLHCSWFECELRFYPIEQKRMCCFRQWEDFLHKLQICSSTYRRGQAITHSRGEITVPKRQHCSSYPAEASWCQGSTRLCIGRHQYRAKTRYAY